MITEEMIKRWMLEDNGNILYDPLHPGVFSGYVNFTRERAKLALEGNTHNRKIRDSQQENIKLGLKNGLWDDNVSKINFESNGTLSEGQHRLEGVVETGIPIRCLVTFGVTREAQLVTDRRGNRNLSDDLTIDGFKNSKNLAAISRVLYARNNGITVKELIHGDSKTYKYPDALVMGWFKDNKDYCISTERLAARMKDLVRDCKITGHVMSVLTVEFDSIDSQDALSFWKRLSCGIATQENDPVVWLRKRLTDNARSNTSRIPKIVEAALIIKAWNFYIKGETTKQLKYTSGGANPEPFPEIYNPYKDN